ncbi:MAG TPA: hypothetical protein VKZ81_31285 [Pseudonocardia sp.]|nr:hypothetical protein [Pseudonocardia sp.]HLU59966.1 hypothetical protein [Pseudonocardia sp.]
MTGPSGDGSNVAALDAARYQGRRLAEIAFRLLGDRVAAEAAAS